MELLKLYNMVFIKVLVYLSCATSTLYWQNAGRSAKLKSSKNNPLMLFNSAFFCKLAVLKKHSLRSVFLELFVLRKPALRQYFFRYLSF